LELDDLMLERCSKKRTLSDCNVSLNKQRRLVSDLNASLIRARQELSDRRLVFTKAKSEYEAACRTQQQQPECLARFRELLPEFLAYQVGTSLMGLLEIDEWSKERLSKGSGSVHYRCYTLNIYWKHDKGDDDCVFESTFTVKRDDSGKIVSHDVCFEEDEEALDKCASAEEMWRTMLARGNNRHVWALGQLFEETLCRHGLTPAQYVARFWPEK
jgi:hypothetical protein